jgi:hypothetical protein
VQLSPETLLTTLIGDLAEVRGRVTALEEQELLDAINGLKRTLGEIVDAVDKLQTQEEESGDDGPGTAPDWTSVDQDQARELWDWLLEWSQNKLYPMYALEVWRPCWYRHPRIRVELTWLCAYWHWSYEKTAPPTRAAEWHARWWPHVEGIMVKQLARCGHADEDRGDLKHEVPADQAEDDFMDSAEQLREFVEAHIARRPPAEKKTAKGG